MEVVLADILRPSWGAEKWIEEGWAQITQEDKELIKSRIDKLFQNGLPFELEKDKLFYIYTFSMLAQLEVLAIQVPLKFKDKLSSDVYKERMHRQLVDEIFHGLVFTKIVFMLCEPHALPPAYNPDIEILCNFIRDEDCPKIAVVLLNQVSEGWIEEVFYSFHRQNIAPAVFEVIIEDEHRHVCEAELYQEIGLPDPVVVSKKMEFLEEQLLTNIFLQYKYVTSIWALVGVQETKKFLGLLNKKHWEQLKKINLVPSEKWIVLMHLAENVLPEIEAYQDKIYEIEKTAMRKVYMTQWSNPTDPTMVGDFTINVSCMDFFAKKHPPETLTTLMLQTVSQYIASDDTLRTFLGHKKLYQSTEAFVALIVKLPDCRDHVGMIVFKNCHEMNVQELALRIRQNLKLMVFCYKKREQLELENPELKKVFENAIYEMDYDFYPYPAPLNPFITLSNIGFTGYKFAKSPLRKNEGMKFTLTDVERKLVWNKVTNEFEPQDLLPLTVTADHRIYDGYIPLPKSMNNAFKDCFERMHSSLASSINIPSIPEEQIIATVEQLVAINPEMGCKILSVMQTMWMDFIDLDKLLLSNSSNKSGEKKLTPA